MITKKGLHSQPFHLVLSYGAIRQIVPVRQSGSRSGMIDPIIFFRVGKRKDRT